jgi:hypothetical protein
LPGRGRIPLDPFDYQQEALLDKSHFRLFNKARQLGMTTIFAEEADFYASRGKGEQIVIVSKNLAAAKQFGKYVRDIALSLEKKDPDRAKIKRITQLLIEYADGSTVQCIASSPETGRSISASRIYFDEVAFTQWVEDIFQAVMPSIEQTGGYMTCFSTPKGRGGLFAKLCKNPAEYGFSYHVFPWWLNPIYNPYLKQFLATNDDKWLIKAKQSEWYQKAKKKYSELAFKQEFECSFDADAGSVYTQRQLDKVFYSHGMKEFYQFDNFILDTHWQKPRVEGHMYASFVDFGRKRDATVIITYDITDKPAEMVEYKRIAPATAEWSDILLEVRNTYAYYKSELRGDATGVGDGIFEAIADIAEPVIISNSQSQGKKYNLIENSRKAYDFGVVRMPKIPQLYEEHEKYTWDDKDIVQDSVIANAGALAIFYDPESEGLFLGADITINAED